MVIRKNFPRSLSARMFVTVSRPGTGLSADCKSVTCWIASILAHVHVNCILQTDSACHCCYLKQMFSKLSSGTPSRFTRSIYSRARTLVNRVCLCTATEKRRNVWGSLRGLLAHNFAENFHATLVNRSASVCTNCCTTKTCRIQATV
ncbi:hypothetical protein DPEC_G00184780 [Dallia pectoralis]|uniref:Uncharacterized protein n=1 Tax=Dallia pectoralis TaxID=75939 RepID=A0ACC2GBE4_DALPE|nr:hypothetical protein DPEC_G00184780 [Dallia pectoralis]